MHLLLGTFAGQTSHVQGVAKIDAATVTMFRLRAKTGNLQYQRLQTRQYLTGVLNLILRGLLRDSTMALSTELIDFQRDGYCVVKRLFDAEEVDLLRRIAVADRELQENIAKRLDAQGGVTTLSLSNELHDDIY